MTMFRSEDEPSFDPVDNTPRVRSWYVRPPIGWEFDELVAGEEGDDPVIYFKPEGT